MTESLIGAVAAPDLHVMSFNVRRRLGALAWRRADRWSLRRPLVEQMLDSERPTLLGVQEALPDQASAIGAALGAHYRFIGQGRQAGGRGEGCPLFYDARRLELIDSAQEALSSTPSVAGSRSRGALAPRVLVQATLRDRATGAQFLVVNTHLDPLSRSSRLKAARRIRHVVRAAALPAIATGDLNASHDSSTAHALLAQGSLRDTWTAAAERLTPAWGTFANYRRPRSGGARIDMVAVTPGVEVAEVGIRALTIDGRWPSDHLPVQARVRIESTA